MGQTREQKHVRKMENHGCECHGSGKDAYNQHRAYRMEQHRVRQLEIARKKALVAMLSANDLHKILSEWVTGGFHRQEEYLSPGNNFLIQDRDIQVTTNLIGDAKVFGCRLPDEVAGNLHFQACAMEPELRVTDAEQAEYDHKISVNLKKLMEGA